MVKLALNALAKRKLSESLGLIFEGTGKNWALRNLRKGKSWEDVGSVSKKHLDAAKPMYKKLSPKGVEISFRTYKTKRTPILKGGIGNSPGFPFSEKFTKSFHTHPYKGISKRKIEDILDSAMKTVYKDKKTRKRFIDEFKKTHQYEDAVKDFGMIKTLSKTERAHPDPRNFRAKGKRTDIDSMMQQPKVHENILNPDDMVLGIHKLRRGGVREVYRQL